MRAEKQSGGIGRLGRAWQSPAGNLYCSTIVDIRAGDPDPSSLSFVAALAVYETIRAVLPDVPMQLKWPNDIIVAGAKICGILLERVEQKIIVGIGINVAVAPEVADRAVTSLAAEGADNAVDAATILASLAVNFAEKLSNWRVMGLQPTLNAWQNHAHPVGSRLQTSQPNGEKLTGEYAGLTADGALRLRKDDGTLIEIRAGDIEIG